MTTAERTAARSLASLPSGWLPVVVACGSGAALAGLGVTWVGLAAVAGLGDAVTVRRLGIADELRGAMAGAGATLRYLPTMLALRRASRPPHETRGQRGDPDIGH